MAGLLEAMALSQGTQPVAAHASSRCARRPSAKVQAMQDDHEQEKITQEQEALVKAKKREERTRKRDQAAKAAQCDPLKTKTTEATTTKVPTVIDKVFESRTTGGLGPTLLWASLATPTLVAQKGNIPPPPAFPKSLAKTLPSRVHVSEPLKLESLSLKPTDTRMCKRARVPTPFPGREAAGDFEDNTVGPPFTQKKRHIVLSDDDDTGTKGGMAVVHDVQPAVGDGGSLPADSKPVIGNEQQVLQSQPTGLSHNGEKMKNRPKAGDYEPAIRRILKTAIEFYHVLLLSENPFPESHVKNDWAKGAWDMSCQYYECTDVINPALIRLITARSSNLRGQFKTKAHSIVATSYGFEMGNGIATRENNQKLAAELKLKSVFACRELHPCRAGLYRNKAIQQVINEVLFKNNRDEGIKWAEYYEPFPSVAFALTLTAIECALDEWASGRHESVSFKEDSYKGIYLQHVKTLKYFQQRMGELNVLPVILQQVYDNERLHAGVVTVQPDDGASLLPDDIIQDIIEEFGQDTAGGGGCETDEIKEDAEDIEVEMVECAEVGMEEGDGDMVE